MKSLKFFGLFFMLLFIGQNTFAQDAEDENKSEFTIDAELRTRGNAINGYKKLPSESNYASYVIEQRTRLGIGYKSGLFDMRISFQDTRIWGDENIVALTGVFGDSASVELNEAWASLKLNDNLQFKIGRQILALDDQRLISARNWLNPGLSYDAASFIYNKNDYSLQLVLSYNNNAFNLFSDEFSSLKMKSLNYIYIKKKFSKDFYISIVNILSGYQPTGSPTLIRFKNTFGPFIKFDNKKLFAKGEFYYQSGKTIDGVNVSAYFFNAEAGYRIDRFYFGAGIDYMSGQDPNKDRADEFRAFDLLYGSRFKYYGNLNYLITPASTKFGGLVNPFAKLSANFNKQHHLTLFYHLFQTAEDVADPANPGEFYDKDLGSEIDLIYTFKMAKGINIKAGYHIAFPTKTMEAFKGLPPGSSETPQWFWASISFKPTIFSSN